MDTPNFVLNGDPNRYVEATAAARRKPTGDDDYEDEELNQHARETLYARPLSALARSRLRTSVDAARTDSPGSTNQSTRLFVSPPRTRPPPLERQRKARRTPSLPHAGLSPVHSRRVCDTSFDASPIAASSPAPKTPSERLVGGGGGGGKAAVVPKSYTVAALSAGGLKVEPGAVAKAVPAAGDDATVQTHALTPQPKDKRRRDGPTKSAEQWKEQKRAVEAFMEENRSSLYCKSLQPAIPIPRDRFLIQLTEGLKSTGSPGGTKTMKRVDRASCSGMSLLDVMQAASNRCKDSRTRF